MPHFGAEVPHFGGIVGHFGAEVPHFGGIAWHFGAEVPHFGGIMWHFGAVMPHFGGITRHLGAEMPHFGAEMPRNSAEMPRNSGGTPGRLPRAARPGPGEPSGRAERDQDRPNGLPVSGQRAKYRSAFWFCNSRTRFFYSFFR